MLDLIPGFNRLRKDRCQTRRETSKFRDLMVLILDIWRFVIKLVSIPKCARSIHVVGVDPLKRVKWRNGWLLINSTWLNNGIWCRASWSILVQLMACCPTTPSHYLNQCWLTIDHVVWNSHEGNYIPRIRRIGGCYGFTSKPPAARRPPPAARRPQWC